MLTVWLQSLAHQWLSVSQSCIPAPASSPGARGMCRLHALTCLPGLSYKIVFWRGHKEGERVSRDGSRSITATEDGKALLDGWWDVRVWMGCMDG